MVLELVAFDIETTGFSVDDAVTVVGFALPLGCRVFVQTAGCPASGVGETIQRDAPVHVDVSVHESERSLLAAVVGFAEERLQDAGVLLVAYNGERWNGGFDLPFLRTRYARLDIGWPFVDVPYADVMPLITKRFNTTVTSDAAGEEAVEHGDLAGAYDVLCTGEYGELDPFADSEEAVNAFDDERLTELVLHNVADVLRTRALGRVAERYCSKSAFNVHSLTPTSES